ncbi:hypothetical protein MmiHf6_11540 [Methanimicrococcus hongohii]|uniref:Right handed beta helix domain-containing protein n=1 Tax=Methanimicrococcus hongohii TaxID=3028295 RepID=A0AA96UZZ7_9EURY|nr:right-handed parallel beta-helix repeat-containing protein [Methanimicrococcus sp. Hf6]WNY23832.1 hypothetical protein MmiHf6_11540 [Methanimicrococcus sp. Hf6]
MYTQKMKTVFLVLFVLAAVSVFAGTASAETIPVSAGTEFRAAIDQINNNSDADNTILLTTDIEIEDALFTAEDYDAADYGTNLNEKVIGINYSKTGTLTIQSDSSGSYKIHSTCTKPNYYPFLNVSGNNITIVAENVSFDGIGMNLKKITDVQINDIRIYNCNNSGMRIDSSENLTLLNVSITECRNDVGGGLHIWYSDNMTIRDCNISNNAAIGVGSSDPRPGSAAPQPLGGGIHILESTVDICGETTICGNIVDGYGGIPNGAGIEADRTYLKIYNEANISNNKVLAAGSATNAVGGGIAMKLAEFENMDRVGGLEIFDSVTISENYAMQGSGIYITNEDGENYICNISGYVKIANNTAEATEVLRSNSGSNANGAGIFTFSFLNLSDNVLISGNKATDISSNPAATSGGGIGAQAPVSISDDVIITKNAAGSGAGMFSFDAVMLSNNISIDQNHANSRGGGLYLDGYSGNKSVISGQVMIQNNTADEEGGGIFGTRAVQMELSDSVSVSDNAAPEGGGIYLRHGSSAAISDNVLIENNTADKRSGFGGGIFVLNHSIADISGNAVIRHNTAKAYAGGIFAVLGEVHISDNVLISENEATDGGGIFVQQGSLVTLSNNTTIEKNYANLDSGFGGGLFLMDSNAVIFGARDESVTFSQNTAADSGGAVYIYILDDSDSELDKYKSFVKATDESNLVFSDNFASVGYLWNSTDQSLSKSENYVLNNLPEMKNTTFTKPFTNAYNNYDIVFSTGDPVYPLFVEIQYYTDSVNSSNLVGAEGFNFYSGMALTESLIVSELGADWINLYQEDGYKSGALQETLPMTLSGDTVLTVLYVQNESGGNPGGNPDGGNGTGNATVIDPKPPSPGPETSVPPGDGGSGSRNPGPEAKPIIVVLLFMVSVACFAYVGKSEYENEYRS